MSEKHLIVDVPEIHLKLNHITQISLEMSSANSNTEDKIKAQKLYNVLTDLNNLVLENYDSKYTNDYNDIHMLLQDINTFLDVYRQAGTMSRFFKKRTYDQDFVNYVSKLARLTRKLKAKLDQQSNCGVGGGHDSLEGLDLVYSDFSTDSQTQTGNIVSETFVSLTTYMKEYGDFLFTLTKLVANSHYKSMEMKRITNDYNDTWGVVNHIYRLNAEKVLISKALHPMNELINMENQDLYSLYIRRQSISRMGSTGSNNNNPVVDQLQANAMQRIPHDNSPARRASATLEVMHKSDEAQFDQFIDDVVVESRSNSISHQRPSLSKRFRDSFRLSKDADSEKELKQKINEANFRQKKSLEKLFLTLLVAERDMFLRSAMQFDEVLNEMPHKRITQCKKEMDALIKKKISMVKHNNNDHDKNKADTTTTDAADATSTAPVSVISEKSLLELLSQQSEEIDRVIRSDALEVCRMSNLDLFLMDLGNHRDSMGGNSLQRHSSTRNHIPSGQPAQGESADNNSGLKTSRYTLRMSLKLSDVKDARRRKVESLRNYLGLNEAIMNAHNSHKDSNYYTVKADYIRTLTMHMFKCGNSLSRALYQQKVSITQFAEQADKLSHVFNEFKIFPAAVSKYVDCWKATSTLYRSSTESLCIINASCPMGLLITIFFPQLLRDFDVRKLYLLDYNSNQRRLKNAKTPSDIEKFQNKVKKSEERLNEITLKIDSKLLLMENSNMNENLIFDMISSAIISQYEMFTYISTRISTIIDTLRNRLPMQLNNQIRLAQAELCNKNEQHDQWKKISKNITMASRMVKVSSMMSSKASFNVRSQRSIAHRNLDILQKSLDKKESEDDHVVQMDPAYRNSIGAVDMQAAEQWLPPDTATYLPALSKSLESSFAEYYDIRNDDKASQKFASFVTPRKHLSMTTLINAGIRNASGKDQNGDDLNQPTPSKQFSYNSNSNSSFGRLTDLSIYNKHLASKSNSFDDHQQQSSTTAVVAEHKNNDRQQQQYPTRLVQNQRVSFSSQHSSMRSDIPLPSDSSSIVDL